MQAALIFHTLTGEGVWLWSVLDCARNNYLRPGVSASSAGLHHVARVRQTRRRVERFDHVSSLSSREKDVGCSLFPFVCGFSCVAVFFCLLLFSWFFSFFRV